MTLEEAINQLDLHKNKIGKSFRFKDDKSTFKVSRIIVVPDRFPNLTNDEMRAIFSTKAEVFSNGNDLTYEVILLPSFNDLMGFYRLEDFNSGAKEA